MKNVKIQMNLEIEDDFLDEIKKIEHHAEYLLDLESYPEILTVYGVKVEEIDILTDKSNTNSIDIKNNKDEFLNDLYSALSKHFGDLSTFKTIKVVNELIKMGYKFNNA